MTLYDTIASLWRTAVPIIVGTLAAWLAHAGIGVDSAALTLWLGAAFSSGYHTLFRLLEAHVSPRFGWLLGLARPAVYPNSAGVYAITSLPDRTLTGLPPVQPPTAPGA